MRAGIGEEFQHFDLARGVGRLGGIELYIKGLVGPGLIDWCEQDARTNGGNGKHTQNKIFWRHGWGFLDKSEIRQIGRATCRERVCQYVYISVVAVSLNKKTKKKKII